MNWKQMSSRNLNAVDKAESQTLVGFAIDALDCKAERSARNRISLCAIPNERPSRGRSSFVYCLENGGADATIWADCSATTCFLLIAQHRLNAKLVRISRQRCRDCIPFALLPEKMLSELLILCSIGEVWEKKQQCSFWLTEALSVIGAESVSIPDQLGGE